MKNLVLLSISIILSTNAWSLNKSNEAKSEVKQEQKIEPTYPLVSIPKFEYEYNFLSKILTPQNKDLKKYLSPYILVEDKKNAQLHLYFYNGTTKLIRTFASLSGKVIGNKQSENDLKTPEGIYFFERTMNKELLFKTYSDADAKQYGPLAITSNYPNTYDKIQNKTGDNIWLHGVESEDRVSKKFDTKGCVATSNFDIVDIADFIQSETTPLIIFDELNVKPEEFQITPPDSIVSFVESWRKAWSNKDINGYINSYDDEFYDKDAKRDKQALKTYKNILNQNYEYINVNLFNISIYKFKEYWIAQFIQEYTAPGKEFKGLKRLYIKERTPNNFSILAEDFMPFTKINYLGQVHSPEEPNSLIKYLGQQKIPTISDLKAIEISSSNNKAAASNITSPKTIKQNKKLALNTNRKKVKHRR